MQFQSVLELRIVQNLEITHQKQPRNARRLHAIDQCIHRQHLLDRAGHDGFFHMLTVERQSWCV
ncbi:hypothetical protein D3C75_1047220 [compost metagenome]